MKKLVIAFMAALFFIMSCGFAQIRPVADCIVDRPDGTQIEFKQLCAEIEAAGRTSYICNLQKEYNFDACYLHRGMEVVAKEGLILEGYTAEEFTKWGNEVKMRLKAGMTYGTLKTIILAQFTKINKMIGAQILVFGDMFLELPQDTFIPADDIEIAISSIDDLVQEVVDLDIWL